MKSTRNSTQLLHIKFTINAEPQIRGSQFEAIAGKNRHV